MRVLALLFALSGACGVPAVQALASSGAWLVPAGFVRAAAAPAPEAPASPAAVAPAAVAPAVRAHDDSRSRTLLVVQGGRLSQFVRLQTLSVAEVLPLDADGNGLVTEAELDAVIEDLAAYVIAHVSLRFVTDGGLGPALDGTLVGHALVTEDADALAFSQWIELELERSASLMPSRLLVETTLFLETSPTHVDWLDVVWAEAAAEGEPLAPLARWSVSLRAGRSSVLLDSGRRTPRETVGSAWHRLGRRPEPPAALILLLLGCGAAGGLRLLAGFGVGLAAGIALSPSLAGSLPALPLAAGLALLVLGAVALLRPAPRPMVVEAAVVGVLMGLHLAFPATLPGPVDDLLLEPLERSEAATSSDPDLLPPWLGAAAVTVAGLALTPLLARLPGRRVDAALVPVAFAAPLAGLGVLLGGFQAWRAL